MTALTLRRLATLVVLGSASLQCEGARTIAPAAPHPNFAATGFSFHNSILVALASFSTVDEVGVQTDADVLVETANTENIERNTQLPPEPDRLSQSILFLTIRRFRADCPPSRVGCPGFIMNAFAIVPLADREFQAPAISPGSRATLNTTVDVFDQVSNSSFEVLIGLTWMCTGDVERFPQENRHFVSPGATVDLVILKAGSFCTAQSLGTISDGLVNFTREPSLPLGTALFSQATVEVFIRP